MFASVPGLPHLLQGCLGRGVLGLDRSAWREKHRGLLWGTQLGAGLRQA